MSPILTNVLSLLSLIVAALALFVSYKTYRKDLPKLELDITNPEYECFFGDVIVGTEERSTNKRISGVLLTIRNNSSVDIQIDDIALVIEKEKYRVIPNTIPFWESVCFSTYDENEKTRRPDINYEIDYKLNGISFPQSIQAYTSVQKYALFYSFPTKLRGCVQATLVLNSAIGSVKKKIKLYEYNDTFSRQEWTEIEQDYRSL